MITVKARSEPKAKDAAFTAAAPGSGGYFSFREALDVNTITPKPTTS